MARRPFGANLQGKDTEQASPSTEPHPVVAKHLDVRQPLSGGNPFWGIPVISLSATRERPIFTATRRPPAPPESPQPVAEAPQAVAEKPPFTLVGTAIGKLQNVPLILDQTTKNLIRLHVGEAASGWCLRSVELRTMALERNSQTVTLSLPEPAANSSPRPLRA